MEKGDFEKVMFCNDKKNVIIFLIVYDVLLTAMILRRFLGCSFFEKLVKKTKFSEPNVKWKRF